MAAPSGRTDNLQAPFPVPLDDVNVPRDIQALADFYDDIMATYISGSALPAAARLGRIFHSTVDHGVHFDTGASWVTITPPLVAALPTTGLYDGLTVRFQVSPGIIWRFVYDSSVTGANKWVFESGPPLFSQDNGTTTYAGSTPSTSGQPPPILPPLAGDYDVVATASLQSPITGDVPYNRVYCAVYRNAVAANMPGMSIIDLPYGGTQANQHGALSCQGRLLNLAKTEAINLRVSTWDSSFNGGFLDRTVKVAPWKVSG